MHPGLVFHRRLHTVMAPIYGIMFCTKMYKTRPTPLPNSTFPQNRATKSALATTHAHQWHPTELCVGVMHLYGLHKETAKPLGNCQVTLMPRIRATIILFSNLAQQSPTGRQTFEGHKNLVKRLYWAIMSCLGIFKHKAQDMHINNDALLVPMVVLFRKGKPS